MKNYRLTFFVPSACEFRIRSVRHRSLPDYSSSFTNTPFLSSSKYAIKQIGPENTIMMTVPISNAPGAHNIHAIVNTIETRTSTAHIFPQSLFLFDIFCSSFRHVAFHGILCRVANDKIYNQTEHPCSSTGWNTHR